MLHRIAALPLAAALAMFTQPATAAEVLGNLYLDVEGRRIDVVSGSSIVDSWALSNSQWSVNVYGDVRTNANCDGCANPSGSQFTLDGTATGVTYGYPAGLGGDADDSTSDGTSNYFISYQDGYVYRTNRDFTNPEVLFSAGRAKIGITYQASNSSLWISDWNESQVTNYTLDGTVLSSFSTGHTYNGGLAYNPLDNTLWLVNNVNSTLEQYSLSGSLLGTNTLGGAGTGYVLGAEFDLAGAGVGGVPEPSAWALLILGFGAIGGAMRRRVRSGVTVRGSLRFAR